VAVLALYSDGARPKTGRAKKAPFYTPPEQGAHGGSSQKVESLAPPLAPGKAAIV